MSEIGKKIIEGLQELTDALESGNLDKFKVTQLTDDHLRDYLKKSGWKREDRAVGPNESEELWVPPWLDRYGFRPSGMSLKSAVKRQLKVDNNG